MSNLEVKTVELVGGVKTLVAENDALCRLRNELEAEVVSLRNRLDARRDWCAAYVDQKQRAETAEARVTELEAERAKYRKEVAEVFGLEMDARIRSDHLAEDLAEQLAEMKSRTDLATIESVLNSRGILFTNDREAYGYPGSTVVEVPSHAWIFDVDGKLRSVSRGG